MGASLDGVGLVHANGHRALRAVTLSIGAAERVAIIGPSGAGKTTLIRLLGTSLVASEGRVEVLGADPTQLGSAALRALRARIGLIHQAAPIPPRLRVVTAVLAGRLGRWSTWQALVSLLRPRDAAGALAALARLDLGDRLWERCDRLSGGQLQRVGVARVLYQDPALILADEPVSALDPTLADATIAALVGQCEVSGATLVASLHAIDIALKWFPRIVGMRNGEIVFDAAVAEVTPPMLDALYAAERSPHEKRRRTAPVRSGRRMNTSSAPRGAAPLVATAPQRDPATRGRLTAAIIAIVVLWPVLALAEFKPWRLFESGTVQVMASFIGAFFPPSTAPDFLATLGRATLETLAIATAGMALAALLAVPLAIAATRSLVVSRFGPPAGRVGDAVRRTSARGTLTFLRALPEVVWALLFVRALGLGPGAGVLAIGLTYAGMLGKVYSEILDSADTRAARALLEAGSPRLGALLYALVPSAAQELASYTVYRWECAVRASVVLGFVGAGGLGQLMDQSMKMLDGGEASAILIVFVLLVTLADAISVAVRKVLA